MCLGIPLYVYDSYFEDFLKFSDNRSIQLKWPTFADKINETMSRNQAKLNRAGKYVIFDH